MNKLNTIYILVFIILLASCVDTRKAIYFNDVAVTDTVNSMVGLEPVIQANDILSITVSSRDLQASAIFNAPNIPATPSGAPAAGIQQAAGYLVSQEGTINFPLLGLINVAGKSKKNVEYEIVNKLREGQLLFDPIVNIRYLNFRITVLGEVARPGVVQIPSEQVSILEAIGMAGDLTIFGKRENVLLIRQEGEKKVLKRFNLNSKDLLMSPYFYLKSNDIVYVEPERAKIASGTRSQQLLPYIISGVSILALVITNIIR
jgi:polysaccharide export outer membrane protein